MPIWDFEACKGLDLEHQALLNVPYRRALALLHLVDRPGDPLCETVARKVEEVHDRGVSNALAISDVAVRELRLSLRDVGGNLARL
jgi:hypothetical protein